MAHTNVSKLNPELT